MQQRINLLLLLLAMATTSWAQLNMSLMSQVQYNADLNDVWGYAAPDGTEYALVGLRNGVSIVSLADPNNAVEVAFIPGQNSTWRDLKTWGDYAYVVTDEGGTTEGVTVIDLSDLPNSANFTRWTPALPGLGTLQTCHNIYIDEFGYAYLAGCNLNSGGMLMIDVFTTPGSPEFVAAAPDRYAHDVYVRDNKMYSSELTRGRMAIYDVEDKFNVELLGVQTTPFEFTHNIWLSDDGNVAYTTDEQANASVGAYDVSDPTDITELDQYRPTVTLGDGVIPHNVHVWEDWLIISYYSDGGIVVDAARPDNLVEVGNFDTFFGGGAGFQGVWGAYPFLPSGIVLLTDIGNGLYVMDVNYVRAAYLEGNVTDAITGAPINGTEVIIESTEEANVNFSRLDGDYATGLAIAGTYDVTFFKPGYEVLTTSATIENGIVTILDVELTPLPRYSKEGLVILNSDGSPVPGAQVIFDDGFTVFEFTGDATGAFVAENVYQGTFNISVGAWGYTEDFIVDFVVDNEDAVLLTLDRGYEDSFSQDFGWTTDASSSTRAGFWVRAEPVGTYRNGFVVNPEVDVDFDLSDKCYTTGNEGGSWSNDDVDGGAVILTSPVMALASNYVDPVVEYNLWFFSGGGNGNSDDDIEVEVSNGTQTVTIEVVANSGSAWRDRSEITLSDFITITDEMQIIFTTSDFDVAGHVVEAGVDAFAVTGELLVATDDVFADVNWKIAPNPTNETFVVAYELEQAPQQAQLRVVNALGQVIETRQVANQLGQERLGENWEPGIYFLYLKIDGLQTKIERLVKQ